MDQPLTAPSIDAGTVLARFRAARWALGRAVLLIRIGVAGAMVIVSARPSGGTRDAGWDVAAFAVYLGWTASPARLAGGSSPPSSGSPAGCGPSRRCASAS